MSSVVETIKRQRTKANLLYDNGTGRPLVALAVGAATSALQTTAYSLPSTVNAGLFSVLRGIDYEVRLPLRATLPTLPSVVTSFVNVKVLDKNASVAGVANVLVPSTAATIEVPVVVRVDADHATSPLSVITFETVGITSLSMVPSSAVSLRALY
jgi:hypothetical protein